LSYYEFFLEQCGIKDCEKLRPLMELSKQVGWTLLYENVVIFSEKPTEIHLNSVGQLHNIEGTALQYADGYSVYAKNGKLFDSLMDLTLTDKLGA